MNKQILTFFSAMMVCASTVHAAGSYDPDSVKCHVASWPYSNMIANTVQAKVSAANPGLPVRVTVNIDNSDADIPVAKMSELIGVDYFVPHTGTESVTVNVGRGASRTFQRGTFNGTFPASLPTCSYAAVAKIETIIGCGRARSSSIFSLPVTLNGNYIPLWRANAKNPHNKKKGNAGEAGNKC